jgi:hypothetical protein
MNKRPSVADAVRRKMEEVAPDPARALESSSPPTLQAAARQPPSTRAGKKFITFPVTAQAKTQFDILAVETGIHREELMRQALRDLFIKHGKPPL